MSRFNNAQPGKPAKSFATSTSSLDFKRMEFVLFTPCPKGLEECLFEEIQTLMQQHQLNIYEITPTHGGLRFKGNLEVIYWLNLKSRIASRVLILLKCQPYHDEKDLYQIAKSVPWHRYFSPNQTLRLDINAKHCPLKSLNFANLAIKDAICDHFVTQFGTRPSIDTHFPDVRVFNFIDSTHCSIYLDSSGQPLFKRGWRVDKGEAPIKENLAAGILQMIGWQPNIPLMDVMCGSGTLMIEAWQIAHNYPAGLHRTFAIENLLMHQKDIFDGIMALAKASILSIDEVGLQIQGSDIDNEVLSIAKQNAQLARTNLVFEQSNALQTIPIASNGIVVVNPPYGERIFVRTKTPIEAIEANDEADINQLESENSMIQPAHDAFFRDWAAQLKQQFAGWKIFVLSNDLNLPTKMRLKPQRKIPLYNGDLDCRLFLFEMIDGSMRRVKQDGADKPDNNDEAK